MKFPQIFMLLVLLCTMFFSCRETEYKEGKSPAPENSIPSAEKHQRTKPSPKKSYPNPNGISRDSIKRKQKKSKDRDTLKPKVAMLE
ncbi:MAG: hypothetical protein GY931_01420 [Maribacter sp.]|nr:hypothetical protein [Maribacter sp.]